PAASTTVPRSPRPAPDVADDPRVQAVLPAVTAAETAVRQATDRLAADRQSLTDARHVIGIAPDGIRTAEEARDRAEETARKDAAAVDRRGENLRVAQLREKRAGLRAERAQLKVTRREGQLATTVAAQQRAAADVMAATTALPELAGAVRDDAPAPEQSLRTTFATVPPRWPDPDGRPAPLPAGGQTHTPGTAPTESTVAETAPKPKTKPGA
ncbi:hypothetical protein NGM37_37265, partial [Streptomyces sp. TRM76130]|nr:hypothetical protein [Streptomyces sp. TRM76130]